jgi:hypothetical protein
MELVKKETLETVYTIKLTQTELNTIISKMAVANIPHVLDFADRKGIKILNVGDSNPFYKELLDIAGIKL